MLPSNLWDQFKKILNSFLRLPQTFIILKGVNYSLIVNYVGWISLNG
jgi:hypothetical protein